MSPAEETSFVQLFSATLRRACVCNTGALGEGMCDNREEMLHRVAKDETNSKMNRRVGALDRINQVIESRVHHRRGLKSCIV